MGRRILLLSIIIGGLSLSAVDLDFNGFLDHYQAHRFQDQGYNASRLRFRGEVRSSFDNAWFLCSFNARNNNVNSENCGIGLHECYLEYIGNNWDIRAGRQIITWGRSDGIRITDIICPLDLTEFITQDFDDIRIPQTSFRIRSLPVWGIIEFAWLPAFEPAILPESGSPWSSVEFPETEFPERKLSNCEYAFRTSLFSSAFDIAVSALHTWEDTPLQNEKLEYKRRNTIGLDLSKAVGDFVFRLESAISPQRYLQNEKGGISQNDFFQNLAGGDWNPGNNWSLSLQVYSEYIAKYKTELQEDEYNITLTCNIERKFLRETLELGNMLYYNIDKDDLYDHVEIDYTLTDELHVLTGMDIFSGDKGKYGVYEDNTQYWFKLRYDF